MLHRIYGLRDPRDDVVCYVGRTCSALEKRLHNHIRSAVVYGQGPKAQWILELIAEGKVPSIQLIRTARSLERARLVEALEILKCAEAHRDRCLNVQHSKPRRKPLNPQQLAKRRSDFMRGNQNARGLVHTPEAKRRIAEANSGERSANAKLSDAEIADIRALYPRVRQTELARRYGVRQGTISNIIRGRQRGRGYVVPADLPGRGYRG